VNVEMREYEVSIRGMVPLLHERFNCEPTSNRRKKTYVPKDEAAKKLYRNKDGKIVQPAVHIEGALINASKNFMMKGRKTYMEFFKSSVIVLPQEIPFAAPENPEDYEIDERPVVIQHSRVMAWRPMWKDWQFDFTVKVLQDDMLDDTTMREVLEFAGAYQGIGSFRPKFGRFEVVKCEAKQ
jgi:hypothetical protein